MYCAPPNIPYFLAGPHPRSLTPRVRRALRACARWHGRRRSYFLAGPHPRSLTPRVRRALRACARWHGRRRSYFLAGPHPRSLTPRVRSALRACARWHGRRRLPLLFEQAVDVLVHIEWHEVVDPLADADVADRQLEIVRDRDGDAAFRRPIELRQHDAVHAGGTHELARLRHAVLADRRIEDEQHFLRRARHFARGDTADLVELVH